MSITVSKYHFIGNETLVEYLADDENDQDAIDQLIERGVPDADREAAVQRVKDERARNSAEARAAVGLD